MKIDMIKLPVRELIKSYSEDDTTSRVVAWDGDLDVRPEYQREYVYDDQKRDSVINTVLHNFPLNIMYFVDRGESAEGARYEVLDGQQRIISLCRFATNSALSVKLPAPTGGYNIVNFPNLFDEQRDAFLDYELQVYICKGTEKEKIDWFEVINIAGERLEKQEIRNAVLHSKWLTDAKSLFSRRNCPGTKNYGKYLSGDSIRQKHLETVFRWHAEAEGIEEKDIENLIRTYMMNHSGDNDANNLWKYVEDVFKWVKKNFGDFEKPMAGVEWGHLYNEHKDDVLDAKTIQKDVQRLMADDEVQKKSGIYEYLLTGEEKHLNLRAFSERERISMYKQQDGKCKLCSLPFKIEEMHADHIVPWSKGGKTDLSNGRMLCTDCNLKKGAKKASV